MNKLALVVCVAGVVLVGCGNKGDSAGKGDKAEPAAGKVASCLAEAAFTCREYSAANLEASDPSPLCTAVDKTAKYTLGTPCPTAKVVATCGGPEGKDFFYAGMEKLVPLADLEKQCKDNGKAFEKR
jgi:hypothetical protein